MHRLFLFVILISVLGQAFRPSGIVASFYWNRAYIAKNLCEKRSVPKNKCNGQCVLMKKLQKAAEQEENAPAPQQEREITWYCSPYPALPVFMHAANKPFILCLVETTWRPQGWIDTVFRPPAPCA
jgi:hypothetical protein